MNISSHDNFVLVYLLWLGVIKVFMCAMRSVMYDSETPWTIAHQAPLSMELSMQEYWSGLSQGIFLIRGSNLHLLYFLHCREFFTC